MDEVKAIITLRSGKEIEQPVPKPAVDHREEEEVEPKHIFIKVDSMKKKHASSISPSTERQKEGL